MLVQCLFRRDITLLQASECLVNRKLREGDHGICAAFVSTEVKYQVDRNPRWIQSTLEGPLRLMTRTRSVFGNCQPNLELHEPTVSDCQNNYYQAATKQTISRLQASSGVIVTPQRSCHA